MSLLVVAAGLEVWKPTVKMIQQLFCLFKVIWIPFTITRVNNRGAKKSLNNLVSRQPSHLNSLYCWNQNTSLEQTEHIVLCLGFSIRQVYFSKMEIKVVSKSGVKSTGLWNKLKKKNGVCIFILYLKEEIQLNILVIKCHLILVFLCNIHCESSCIYLKLKIPLWRVYTYIFTDRTVLLTYLESACLEH